MQLDAVIDVLKARGHRVTQQRRAIVAEVMRARGHISVQDVVKRLPKVNASTVYRTLDLLENLGVVAHAHLEDGAEYHRAESHDHVHLVCARCGRRDSLSTAETAPLRELITRHNGFEADFTHFAVSGLCARCRAAED
jgi:Fur family ferric uptake transcriptional regulator